MTIKADVVRFAAPRWGWMTAFCTRINTGMGKDPLYPFEIPDPVVGKLGFVHRVVGAMAAASIAEAV